MKKLIIAALFLIAIITTGCRKTNEISYSEKSYGVYLSCTYEELPQNLHLDVIVIDAQYYSAEEISKLQKNNRAVYSYINLGSIECFRDYYEEYKQYCLAPYENWDEEYWMDVTQKDWHRFIEGVAKNLADKGICGLFVDNVDVYYHYPTQEMFDSVATILKGFKNLNLDVIINGGDVFISKYLTDYGSLSPILDGVNQESVFSTINWETNTFGINNEEDKEYFMNYLSAVAADGKEVYLLEYTVDSSLIKEIKERCAMLGYHYYISDSIELD